MIYIGRNLTRLYFPRKSHTYLGVDIRGTVSVGVITPDVVLSDEYGLEWGVRSNFRGELTQDKKKYYSL